MHFQASRKSTFSMGNLVNKYRRTVGSLRMQYTKCKQDIEPWMHWFAYYTPCSLGRFLSISIPLLTVVIFAVGVIAVVDPWLGAMTDIGITLIGIGVLLVILFMTAFIRAAMSDPGSVPLAWHQWDGQLPSRPTIPEYAVVNPEWLESSITKARNATTADKLITAPIEALHKDPTTQMMNFQATGMMMLTVEEDEALMGGVKWTTVDFDGDENHNTCDSGECDHGHGGSDKKKKKSKDSHHGDHHGHSHGADEVCDHKDDSLTAPPAAAKGATINMAGAWNPANMAGMVLPPLPQMAGMNFTWADVQWPVPPGTTVAGATTVVKQSAETDLPAATLVRPMDASPMARVDHTVDVDRPASTTTSGGQPFSQQPATPAAAAPTSLDPYPTVFCEKCKVYKPPRTHHCSTCGRCVTRMDHHCVWLNNCVGHRNHKHFLLFLVYVTLAIFYFLFLVTWSIFFNGLPSFTTWPGILTYMTVVAAILFARFTTGVLMYQYKTMQQNITQIEEMFQPMHGLGRYHSGNLRKNIELLLGPNPWTWFLPL